MKVYGAFLSVNDSDFGPSSWNTTLARLFPLACATIPTLPLIDCPSVTPVKPTIAGPATAVGTAVGCGAAHTSLICVPGAAPFIPVGQLIVIWSPAANVMLCWPAHDERTASGMSSAVSKLPMNIHTKE